MDAGTTSKNSSHRGTPSFAEQHRHLVRGGRYVPRWFRATAFWQRLPGAHRAVLDQLYQSLAHEATAHASGLTVRRGEWLWTYSGLAKASGVTPKQARTAIAKAKASGIIATGEAYYTDAAKTIRLLRISWLDFDAYEWPDAGENGPSAGRPKRPNTRQNGQTEMAENSTDRADRQRQANRANNGISSRAQHITGQTGGQIGGQIDGQTGGQHDEPSSYTHGETLSSNTHAKAGFAGAAGDAHSVSSRSESERIIAVLKRHGIGRSRLKAVAQQAIREGLSELDVAALAEDAAIRTASKSDRPDANPQGLLVSMIGDGQRVDLTSRSVCLLAKLGEIEQLGGVPVRGKKITYDARYVFVDDVPAWDIRGTTPTNNGV